MVDIFDFFDEKLIFDELGESPVKITTPETTVDSGDFEYKEIEQQQLLTLPQGLIDLYSQISSIRIAWSLSALDEKSIRKFQNDEWLKLTYLDKGYDWGVVNEYLSGFINITKPGDLFDPGFCSRQGYYYTLSNKGECPDSFFPLDICWSLTACLKKKDNILVDNIWLVHTDANDIYDMNIGVEEYLKLAYLAKCFHYWQIVFLFKEKTEFYDLMKRYLPKILPHIQLNLKDFGIE